MIGSKMPTRLDLQVESTDAGTPDKKLIAHWVESALQKNYPNLEQTVRVVDDVESRELNRRYRDKDSATNVLAFPVDGEFLDYDCLGDLVICAPLVAREAEQQGKTTEAHWAHLVVHGMLHLQGYDHQNDRQQREMEALEIKILNTLGYTNPYND